MRLQDLLDKPPRVHGRGQALFKLSDDVLRFIDESVKPGSVTFETGAGISSILFALKGTRHTAVVPDAAEPEAILAYCGENGIRVDQLTFKIGRSESVLPQLQLPPLDLVLIDGRHGFPTPFLDWFYTASALQVGGRLIVDDTQLWTGFTLKRFLQEEPEWELERDFLPRASAFRKLANGSTEKSWTDQPYVVRNTTIVARLNRAEARAARMRRLVELIRNRQFGFIIGKAIGRR